MGRRRKKAEKTRKDAAKINKHAAKINKHAAKMKKKKAKQRAGQATTQAKNTGQAGAANTSSDNRGLPPVPVAASSQPLSPNPGASAAQAGTQSPAEPGQSRERSGSVFSGFFAGTDGLKQQGATEEVQGVVDMVAGAAQPEGRQESNVAESGSDEGGKVQTGEDGAQKNNELAEENKEAGAPEQAQQASDVDGKGVSASPETRPLNTPERPEIKQDGDGQQEGALTPNPAAQHEDQQVSEGAKEKAVTISDPTNSDDASESDQELEIGPVAFQDRAEEKRGQERSHNSGLLVKELAAASPGFTAVTPAKPDTKEKSLGLTDAQLVRASKLVTASASARKTAKPKQPSTPRPRWLTLTENNAFFIFSTLTLTTMAFILPFVPGIPALVSLIPAVAALLGIGAGVPMLAAASALMVFTALVVARGLDVLAGMTINLINKKSALASPMTGTAQLAKWAREGKTEADAGIPIARVRLVKASMVLSVFSAVTIMILLAPPTMPLLAAMLTVMPPVGAALLVGGFCAAVTMLVVGLAMQGYDGGMPPAGIKQDLTLDGGKLQDPTDPSTLDHNDSDQPPVQGRLKKQEEEDNGLGLGLGLTDDKRAE